MAAKNQYTKEVIVNDTSRFEQFCQFRDTIRSSRNHLIVGIDIAKDKHHAFFGTPYGKTLWRRLIFTNDLVGYKWLIEQVEVLLSQHQLSQVVFGLEPTGNYHKPLAYWLIQRNYLVVLVAGKAVKDNRELLDGCWDKNDTKDSANAADLVSQGRCQFYEQPDSALIAVRNLLVMRKQLKKRRTQIAHAHQNRFDRKILSGAGSALGQLFGRKSGHRALVPRSAKNRRHRVQPVCAACDHNRQRSSAVTAFKGHPPVCRPIGGPTGGRLCLL